MDNYFAKLNSINVSEHIEKKGSFAYLSWPYAVAQLRQLEPSASWEVRRFDGLPYQKTELGYFVEVAVTVQGPTLSQIHPVLDSYNDPIELPTAFEINTSIQRCLVKAIALHGIGLYVYAGEDLPETDKQRVVSAAPKPPVAMQTAISPASPAQLRYIERLIQETASELTQVLAFFGVESLDKLTVQTASRAITSLEKQRRAA